MRYQAIQIHARGEKARDREWAMLVTEFLGMYTNDLSRELLAQATEMKTYISALTSQLKEAASKLESGSFPERRCESELIHPFRCANRGSPCAHNRDT